MSTIYSISAFIGDVINNFITVDIVGFYDTDSLKPIFINATPTRAEVNETSTIMKHPLENGSIIADHHIINPVSININIIVNNQHYNSTYFEIRNAWLNGSKFIIQTRTAIYNNIIIADMPHSETIDKYNAVEIQLKCVEVLYNIPSVTVQPIKNYSTTFAEYFNTITTGLRYATTLPKANATTATGLIAAGLLKGY